MSDFGKTVANYLSHVLQTARHRLRCPYTSQELLCFFIALNASGNEPTLKNLRLADLPRFETALEDLAHSSETFDLTLKRDHDGLSIIDIAFTAAGSSSNRNARIKKRKRNEEDDSAEEEDERDSFNSHPVSKYGLSEYPKDLQEVYALLQRPTAKARLLAEQFRSVTPCFEPICRLVTKDECAKARQAWSANASACGKVHFRAIIRPHTDPNLGHCSYLNTCYSEPSYALSPSIPPTPSRYPGQSGRFQSEGGRGASSLPSGLGAGGRGKEKAPCRYLHFEVDYDGDGSDTAAVAALPPPKQPHKLSIGRGPTEGSKVLPPQWINCDVRHFDYKVLGKFHVIMADPPWDIHMSLPYGTMNDEEMLRMDVPSLQDEGLIFLWVTGRAMEVGRECLRVWGYRRVDEVVWVKCNQLQRMIRTGRTGHWLNHTKEHMLVGLKSRLSESGDPIWPTWINRGLDTDVIVSEVRETSRKPEEAYGLIERMCPGGRKIEIFGRKHNARPGWITLGNQLGDDQIFEEDLKARILNRYPEKMQE